MEPLTRAIRTLTIAVWCLCALVLALIGLYGFSYVRSARMMREAMSGAMRSSTVTSTSGRSSAPVPVEADEPSLHDVPPEQMVARSSVILLTSYQKDGDRFKAVVAEILKQKPDTKLYYGVGDELAMLSFHPKDGETCGEGQVVFMTGSPASMRSSYSFTNGRIGGMGDMPLSTLREMVKATKP